MNDFYNQNRPQKSTKIALSESLLKTREEQDPIKISKNKTKSTLLFSWLIFIHPHE